MSRRFLLASLLPPMRKLIGPVWTRLPFPAPEQELPVFALDTGAGFDVGHFAV